MTAYWDGLEHDAATVYKNTKVVDSVIPYESEAIKTVSLATGDREFPDDLRQKIQGLIARWRLQFITGELQKESVEWLQAVSYSRLLQELHSAFHEVASRRVKTRFGMLSDSPSHILALRREWEQEQEDAVSSNPR